MAIPICFFRQRFGVHPDAFCNFVQRIRDNEVISAYLVEVAFVLVIKLVHICYWVIGAGLIRSVLSVVPHGGIIKEHISDMTRLPVQRVARKGRVSDSAFIIESLSLNIQKHIRLAKCNIQRQEFLSAGGCIIHFYVYVVLCGPDLAGHANPVAVRPGKREAEYVLIQFVSHIIAEVFLIHFRIFIEAAGCYDNCAAARFNFLAVGCHRMNAYDCIVFLNQARHPGFQLKAHAELIRAVLKRLADDRPGAAAVCVRSRDLRAMPCHFRCRKMAHSTVPFDSHVLQPVNGVPGFVHIRFHKTRIHLAEIAEVRPEQPPPKIR